MRWQKDICKWCELLARTIETLLAGLKLKERCQMVEIIEENLNLVKFLCEGLKPNSSDEQFDEVKSSLQYVESEMKSKTGTLKKR